MYDKSNPYSSNVYVAIRQQFCRAHLIVAYIPKLYAVCDLFYYSVHKEHGNNFGGGMWGHCCRTFLVNCSGIGQACIILGNGTTILYLFL
jgi:hypothetical protein